MPTVTCPVCGSGEDLEGRRSDDGVVIDCGACGHSWVRDLTPVCNLCGSTDLVAVPTATLEEAGRGDQRTPSGIRDVYRCYACGTKDATSSSPTPDPEWMQRTSSVVEVPRSRDESAPAARSRAAGRKTDSAFGLFAPGETIGGRWRVQRRVHRSTTGSLWLAQAVDADRRVVFKLVHPRLTRDRSRAALYASAAGAVMEVRHQHLLSVLDVKVRDGQVLVVAEAVDGTVQDASAELSGERLVAVGRAIAPALAALHAQRVAHLDVRPNKILIAATGETRLVDLGSGRVRAAMRMRSGAGERVAFRAPEQILNHDHGPAADVYSLGLTLWTLAGGDLTSMGANPSAQASYRLTHNVPELDATSAALPEHLAAALAAATRRAPDLRPTAVELAELLRGD